VCKFGEVAAVEHLAWLANLVQAVAAADILHKFSLRHHYHQQ
jgi:hypothetical protein